MNEGLQKMADTALLYSLPVAIIGAVFKYLHYPYANQMLIVGLTSVAIAALLKYIPQKNAEGYLLAFGIAAGCMLTLFKLVHFSF
jgi:hypothetical protein